MSTYQRRDVRPNGKLHLPKTCTFTGHEDQILCKTEADALQVCKKSACWRDGYTPTTGPVAYYASAEGVAADLSFTTHANGGGASADPPMKAEYHHHPHHSLIFMFVALAMGCGTEWFLCRYAHWMPYTVAILLEGGILAIANAKSGEVHWLCQIGRAHV